jgi:hypothetical protein
MASVDGGSFDERDVSLTNPRALHRNLILELEDLHFIIQPGIDEAVEVTKEALGEYTGHFTSKILGKGQEVYGGGNFQHGRRSAGLLAGGAVLFLIGLILLFASSAILGVAMVIVALAILGTALFSGKTNTHSDVMLRAGVGIFVQGEVTEKTQQRGDSRITELEGNALVSVGSYFSIRALPNADRRTSAALLGREPRAFHYHNYASSSLLALLNPATMDAVKSHTTTLKSSVAMVISRLSKFSDVRYSKS